MADDNINKQAEELLGDIWGRRAEGLPLLDFDLTEPVRKKDLDYLREYRYPFLQIISSEPDFPDELVPEFYQAPSGWVIHDYGAAMSSSPGKHLFGPGYPGHLDDDDEGGGSLGETDLTGKGTIIKQIYDTAQAMVELAKQKNWPGVDVIAGTEMMKWAAWMAAEDRGMKLEGFEPSEKDQERRERIKRNLHDSDYEVVPKQGPGRGRR